MSDDPTDDKPGKDNVIQFPNGKSVDPNEVGIEEYFAAPVGTIPQSELIDPRDTARELRDRQEYIENQELVRVARNNSPTSATIDVILMEIAEELSHLKWERRQSAKKGKNTASLTIARIGTLKQMTDILIKRKETSLNERLTTKDPRIQKLFEIWVEMFHSSMEKCGVTPEIMDLIFSQIKTEMLDWETKMESINA